MRRHMRAVPLIPTLLLLAATLGLMVFAGWRGAQPPDVVRGPRMAPWRFLMLLSGAVAFLLVIHLGALAGFGPPT
ncbi:hypothetical protein [Brevundimonas sp. NIBR10]|uniref:hypothetical protein n=1 Tax=Brevundimonas sp. NIBR10 TaxID=3015997 RepID=UPI0022F15612|nr:hypothetical protein [Brevundimonas sp. NIBR10]